MSLIPPRLGVSPAGPAQTFVGFSLVAEQLKAPLLLSSEVPVSPLPLNKDHPDMSCRILPVTISYKTTPSEKMSALLVHGCPIKTCAAAEESLAAASHAKLTTSSTQDTQDDLEAASKMELIWCSPGQRVPRAWQKRFRVRQDVGKSHVCDLCRALRADQHVAYN